LTFEEGKVEKKDFRRRENEWPKKVGERKKTTEIGKKVMRGWICRFLVVVVCDKWSLPVVRIRA
jgi:hypothetical protein